MSTTVAKVNNKARFFPLRSVIFVQAVLSLFLPAFSYALSYVPLESGSYSNFKTPMIEVFHSQAELADFWNQHDSNESVLKVDFDANMVIVIFRGTMNSGGYGVDIVSIEETDTDVVVKYEFTDPSPDDMVTLALTEPYLFASVEKSDKTVTFELVKKNKVEISGVNEVLGDIKDVSVDEPEQLTDPVDDTDKDTVDDTDKDLVDDIDKVEDLGMDILGDSKGTVNKSYAAIILISLASLQLLTIFVV